MADLNNAFNSLKHNEKTITIIDYFFLQRKINEEQEFLDKKLNRINKQISVPHSFLGINLPIVENLRNNEIRYNIEIFGDSGYRYKGYLVSNDGTIPNLMIPLKSDKKMFINITTDNETVDMYKERIKETQNYICFIDIPKKYQNTDSTTHQHLTLDEQDEDK